MSTIKCPLPDENTKKQLLDNQTKLLYNLEKEEVNNKKTNYTFYSRFKSWNKGIKDFFKSFFKTIRIPFSNNKNNYTYIAFIPNGGIGDIIRQKSILNSMIDMNENIVIDVYNKKSRKYGIFRDIKKNIRFFIDKNAIKMTSYFYDIIISFDNYYKDGVFLNFKQKSNKVFINKLKSNIQIYRKKYFQSFNNNFCINGRQDKIINRNKIISGVDDINSDNLKLLYNKSSLEKFKIFNDTLYITFQNGHGLSSHKENTHIKCWDTKKWEELLSLLKTNLPDNIKIVQVGLDGYIFDKADIKLAGNTNFDELCSVLEKSILHIDADCGCVHICKALGTTSLVLFGPTDVDYLGYDNNINISSSLCGNCFRANYSSASKCPLGYSKPLCMESISPQFVFHTVTEYLKTKGIINNNDYVM
jgi:ADP-heptose:LPS heptosyltransferase